MDRRSFLKRALTATALVPVATVAKTILPKDNTLVPLNPDPPGAFTTDSIGLFDGDTLLMKKSLSAKRCVISGDTVSITHETKFEI